MRSMSTVLFATILLSSPAIAETELSFYGGAHAARLGRVIGNDPGGVGRFDFLASWDSQSSTPARYHGVRLTRWQRDDWGWALDFSHGNINADAATLSGNGLSLLGFSDGMNVLTVNRYRQWRDLVGPVTPYLGAGLGVTIPHVEFDSGAGKTSEYQFGGPAVSLVAGAKYPMNSRWSVFGEYKGTYSVNNVELMSGGNLGANLVTNSINLGASFGF